MIYAAAGDDVIDVAYVVYVIYVNNTTDGSAENSFLTLKIFIFENILLILWPKVWQYLQYRILHNLLHL